MSFAVEDQNHKPTAVSSEVETALCRSLNGDEPRIELSKDVWLSSMLGRPCGRLKMASEIEDLDPGKLQSLSHEWWAACNEFMANQGPENRATLDEADNSPVNDAANLATCSQEFFFDAKVPTENTQTVSLLQRFGFQVVDVNVTLEWNSKYQTQTASLNDCLATKTSASNADCSTTSVIEPWESEKHEHLTESVKAVGRESFQYSRFHLDRSVPNEIADRIKAEWVGNCLSGQRKSRIWLAVEDGKVAGFLTAIEIQQGDRHHRSVIDLVAVGTEFQGRGIGQRLSQAFIEYYGDSDSRLQVGTQIANAPALRLYQRLGFQPISSSYVLHGHFQSSQPNEV